MTTKVVESEFPLLLGNTAMKKAGAVLFLNKEKTEIIGNKVTMRETSSGHFSLRIEKPRPGLDFYTVSSDVECLAASVEDQVVSCLMAKTEELSLKDVQDLHHKFGHASVKRLGELIKNANRLTENVQRYLNYVHEKCQSCM